MENLEKSRTLVKTIHVDSSIRDNSNSKENIPEKTVQCVSETAFVLLHIIRALKYWKKSHSSELQLKSVEVK